MAGMRISLPAIPPPTTLHPPRGYRFLAWLGLGVNLLLLPLALMMILRDPVWRATNIAVGAGAVLPAIVVGLIACIALLRWRHWGQVLAIVALSMDLATTVPYTIVRLVLIPQDRFLLAMVAPLSWALNAAVLVYWCRPAIRQYLR
jgi:hypothetical protein